MKKNISQVKYNEQSNIPDKCTWYSWDEYCDRCGKHIRVFKEFITTREPDVKEEDRCLDCLRLLFNDYI